MTACDSGETVLVKFVAQKAANQWQRRPKKENWELCAEKKYDVTISTKNDFQWMDWVAFIWPLSKENND